MPAIIKSKQGLTAEISDDLQWTVTNGPDAIIEPTIRRLDLLTELASDDYTAGQGYEFGYVAQKVAKGLGWEVVSVTLPKGPSEIY